MQLQWQTVSVLILFHPDCHRRLRSFTGSADLCIKSRALAGFPDGLRHGVQVTAGGEFHPALRTAAILHRLFLNVNHVIEFVWSGFEIGKSDNVYIIIKSYIKLIKS